MVGREQKIDKAVDCKMLGVVHLSCGPVAVKTGKQRHFGNWEICRDEWDLAI